MGQVICHHNNVYNIYTTIADGFYWEEGLTEEQLKEWYKEEYGRKGIEELPARIERAKKYGTSSHCRESLKSVVECNRAGNNEEQLSYEEILQRFFNLANHDPDRANHDTQKEDHIMPSLEHLRSQWEYGGELMCSFNCGGDDVVLSIVARGNLYCCYRYFAIGNDWQVSQDQYMAPPARVFKWIEKMQNTFG